MFYFFFNLIELILIFKTPWNQQMSMDEFQLIYEEHTG